MQKIFQRTEIIKKDVMAKIAENSSVLALMKGEQENIKGEVKKIDFAPKVQEVTLENINIMKPLIFEIKDFTLQKDNFVRQNLLTKVEINSTLIEDINTMIKNLNNKYSQYKTTSDNIEQNIRE